MAVQNPASSAEGIQIAGQTSTQTLQPPGTSGLSQVADAFAHTADELTPFLGTLGEHLKADQVQRATADAFKTSGAAFADAVRSGKLQPTQNPWYVKAYNEAAAKLSSRTQIDSLVLQSQSWAERNDHAAYATRLQNEIGQIGASLPQNRDSLLGFNEMAAPLLSEALSQNEGLNSKRIEQEHLQNTTSLSAHAVMDALKAAPGATPDAIFASMDEQHRAWIAVGGTEPAWRLIAIQAVRSAAAQLTRPDLIDALNAPYQGTPPLATQADENGKPMSDVLLQDKFWIDRAQDAAANQAYKLHQAQVTQEGIKVDEWARQTYGNDYSLGRIERSQMEADAVAHGFSGEAVAWAESKLAENVRGIAGLGQAQTELFSQDPQVQQQLLELEHKADVEGLTPGLHHTLGDMLMRHQITLAMAQRLEDKAVGQSHFATELAHQDANAARSNALASRSLDLSSWSLVGHAGDQALAEASDNLRRQGFDPARLTPTQRRSFEKTTTDAAVASGQAGPVVALQNAREASANWVNTYVAGRRAHAAPPGTDVGNAAGAAVGRGGH